MSLAHTSIARRAQRERDGDHAGAGADVGDPAGAVADPLERRVDELLRRGARREDPAGVGDEGQSVEVASASSLVQRSPMDWIPSPTRSAPATRSSTASCDERALVRRGNTAYAAGLALPDGGRPGGGASGCGARPPAGARAGMPARAATPWGRPIGALKASLLAGDDAAVEELARWTLELGAATAESPIGRYAGALALLALGRWPEARHVAESLRERDDFPHDVADALAYIAAHDVVGYIEAVESVVESFETRDGVPRGRRRSPTRRSCCTCSRAAAASSTPLPAVAASLPERSSRSRPARSRGGTRS